MPKSEPLDQVQVDHNITMGTLANDTGIVSSDANITQNYKAVSLHAVIAIRVLDAADGPILYGLCPGEVSLAEIEQYLESAPNSKRDTPEIDQVSIPVQVLGQLTAVGIASTLKGNAAEWIKERILLPTFRENQGWQFWVYNAGIAMTTGSSVILRGRYFGRWLD